MRNILAISFVAALALGCASEHKPASPAVLSYFFHSADISEASVQPIDPDVLRWTVQPDYQAELHLKLNDQGVQRFEHFNQAYEGQVFDVLVENEMLASGLTAHPLGPVVEMVWYVASMEEAKHFANILNAR